MKRAVCVFLAVVMAAALLASCSSGKSSAPMAPGGGMTESNSQSDYAPPGAPPYDGEDGRAEDAGTGSGLNLSGTAADLSLSEKIIYSYSAQIETTQFDETIDNVGILLESYGAFIESSYISGHTYSNKRFRTASYTIRVPVQNFTALTGSLSILGNVYNENTNSLNITAEFTDTQSRLSTYRTEESRLLSMLEKSETVADMIIIEERLSDVRYRIESLTSTLTNWQNRVDYSDVTLDIREVAELSEQLSMQRTYWQQLGDGFSSTLRSVGVFFKNVFKTIVVFLPVLVLLAVIAIAVVVIVRLSARKKKKDGDPK